MTATTEGTIRYRLDFSPAPAPPQELLRELNAWRSVIRMLDLNGLDPGRYEGLAYGNVSLRLADDPIRFLISGTQTGGQRHLSPADYCEVDGFDLEANRLSAHGLIPPSSEALTHAAVYLASKAWCCVIHAHSPEIWCHAARLGLPTTSASIEYGTPAMALAAQALAATPGRHVIAMGGHVDGIIGYGETVEATAQILIGYLAMALQLEHP